MRPSRALYVLADKIARMGIDAAAQEYPFLKPVVAGSGELPPPEDYRMAVMSMLLSLKKHGQLPDRHLIEVEGGPPPGYKRKVVRSPYVESVQRAVRDDAAPFINQAVKLMMVPTTQALVAGVHLPGVAHRRQSLSMGGSVASLFDDVPLAPLNEWLNAVVMPLTRYIAESHPRLFPLPFGTYFAALMPQIHSLLHGRFDSDTLNRRSYALATAFAFIIAAKRTMAWTVLGVTEVAALRWLVQNAGGDKYNRGWRYALLPQTDNAMRGRVDMSLTLELAGSLALSVSVTSLFYCIGKAKPAEHAMLSTEMRALGRLIPPDLYMGKLTPLRTPTGGDGVLAEAKGLTLDSLTKTPWFWVFSAESQRRWLREWHNIELAPAFNQVFEYPEEPSLPPLTKLAPIMRMTPQGWLTAEANEQTRKWFAYEKGEHLFTPVGELLSVARRNQDVLVNEADAELRFAAAVRAARAPFEPESIPAMEAICAYGRVAPLREWFTGVEPVQRVDEGTDEGMAGGMDWLSARPAWVDSTAQA